MVFAEGAERKTVEVLFVRRVAERAVIGVVRRFDADAAAGLHQPVEFLHGPDDIAQMLDYVDRTQAVEGAVGERIGEPVEIADDVGRAGRVDVDTNGALVLANAAADIQRSQENPPCVPVFPCRSLSLSLEERRVPLQADERSPKSGDRVLRVVRRALHVERFEAGLHLNETDPPGDGCLGIPDIRVMR